MGRRRRSAPVSVLRTRLNKRLSEQRKDRPSSGGAVPKEEKKFFFLSFSLGFLKSMNRHFYLKMAVALILVLALGISGKMGWSWSAKIIDGARYIVNWDMDLRYMQENMIPAIKQIRIDEMLKKMPFLNDAGDDDALLPVNGEFKSGFGLRENPASGKEEMHYGLDLLAERGALVKAVLPGKVDKIEEAGEETRIILQHDDGWTTVYGGVAEVRVKAGEEVQAAQVLGMLDSARLWKRPHLHFELQLDGRPQDPLLLLRHFAPSEDDPET
ncbi:MAG: M23 family metallopeptidase [Dethiobacteria bacterium]